MDEKDITILAAVARLGTGSSEKIAEETGIPKSTIHYRLENMQDSGLVENDIFDIDLAEIGLNLTVITEVSAQYREGYHDDVGQKLSEVEGVNQVYFTMGDTDFVVIAHLANRGMIEQLIEQYEAIDEVEKTSSKFVVKTIKNESRPLNDYETESLINLFDNSPE